MGFWDSKSASASRLRLFEPTQGWRARDVKDDQGRINAQGSSRAIELALHNALNASPNTHPRDNLERSPLLLELEAV